MRVSKSIPVLICSVIALGCAGAPVEAVPPVAAPSAQSGSAVQASPALVQRADQLVGLINGTVDPTTIFAPKALERAPAEQLTRLAKAVRERRGEALGVNRIEPITANSGKIYIDFEGSQMALKIRVEDAAPHLIDGLMMD